MQIKLLGLPVDVVSGIDIDLFSSDQLGIVSRQEGGCDATSSMLTSCLAGAFLAASSKSLADRWCERKSDDGTSGSVPLI
jgi:hypothetical protein